MSVKVGTLRDLHLMPRDLVECIEAKTNAFVKGHQYYMTANGLSCERSTPQKSTTSLFRVVRRAADAPTAPTGPVRTVTRKEIVPGSYGGVEVTHVDGFENVCIRIDTGFSAIGLRAAIATLTEIADALEDQQ